jgi:hypothetical protein
MNYEEEDEEQLQEQQLQKQLLKAAIFIQRGFRYASARFAFTVCQSVTALQGVLRSTRVQVP